MDRHKLIGILENIASGRVSPYQAAEELKDLPYADMEFARVDSHRALRQGLPEVIFCPGKTPLQVSEIANRLRKHHELTIATKADAPFAQSVIELSPEARFMNDARAIVWGDLPQPDEDALVVNIITAGTGDIPIAEEAALFVTAARALPNRLYDVGVAGIHRLIDNLKILRKGAVTIVVAGMDGALPSVVGGLLDGPVIAVPSAIGYGTAFGGIAPLLTMLNSCAAGVTVVNIDNGFGAAMGALRIARTVAKAQSVGSIH